MSEGAVPGGTLRNIDSCGHKVGPISDAQQRVLCDPQTSGGLLVAVEEYATEEFEDLVEEHLGISVTPFVVLTPMGHKRILVT